MQRKQTEGHGGPRRNAERDAAQPMGGQPRADDDDDEILGQPEDEVPSFLTARELQARDPAESFDGDSKELLETESDDVDDDEETPRGKGRKPTR